MALWEVRSLYGWQIYGSHFLHVVMPRRHPRCFCTLFVLLSKHSAHTSQSLSAHVFCAARGMKQCFFFLFLQVYSSLASCSLFTSCEECTTYSGCVWCERNPVGVDSCLVGGVFGPDASPECISGDWRWSQCNASGLYVISLGIVVSILISIISLCCIFACCKGMRKQVTVTSDYYNTSNYFEMESQKPAADIPYYPGASYEYDDWNPEEVQKLFAAAHPTASIYNSGPTEQEKRAADYYEKYGI
eukprot:TRINITY_DN15411_c0_g1_i1.p1 TRINITY_DN15411_c0_g1~~TRINITY_DN15411_c0_g1_i1.p1  ORF type:complete len:245 (+),score=21.96 TRINITY_DN15411_c0_g1_i1:44-778(+)